MRFNANECDVPAKKICLSYIQTVRIKLVAALHANSSVLSLVIISEVFSTINEISHCECKFMKQEVSSISADKVCQDLVKRVGETNDTIRRPQQISFCLTNFQYVHHLPQTIKKGLKMNLHIVLRRSTQTEIDFSEPEPLASRLHSHVFSVQCHYLLLFV